MSCPNEPKVYCYLWKDATIEIISCVKHFSEISTQLNFAQSKEAINLIDALRAIAGSKLVNDFGREIARKALMNAGIICQEVQP